MVGVGNVALDVARVLVKSADQLDDTDMADEVLEVLAGKAVTDVHVLGRRGPAYTTFTTKELRELGQLDDIDVIVDPADLELDDSSRAVVEQDKVAARNLAVFRDWAGATARHRCATDALPLLDRPTGRLIGDRPGGRRRDREHHDRRRRLAGRLRGRSRPSPPSWSSARSGTAVWPCPASRTTTAPAGCRTPRAG